MSWTYTGLPETATAEGRRDAVRLLIQDTDNAAQLFQDEEISFALAQENNSLYRAAALLLDALSKTAQQSRSIGDLSISSQSGGFSALATRYRMLATRGAMPFAGGISVSDKETRTADTDRVRPAFTRELHQTPGLDSVTGSSS